MQILEIESLGQDLPWGRASLTKILLFNQLDLCQILTTQFCVRFSATHKWVEICWCRAGVPGAGAVQPVVDPELHPPSLHCSLYCLGVGESEKLQETATNWSNEKLLQRGPTTKLQQNSSLKWLHTYSKFIAAFPTVD